MALSTHDDDGRDRAPDSRSGAAESRPHEDGRCPLCGTHAWGLDRYCWRCGASLVDAGRAPSPERDGVRSPVRRRLGGATWTPAPGDDFAVHDTLLSASTRLNRNGAISSSRVVGWFRRRWRLGAVIAALGGLAVVLVLAGSKFF